MRLVVGSNSEIFWLAPRRGDAGVTGSTSRSRNDGSGQKGRNYEYELTARDGSPLPEKEFIAKSVDAHDDYQDGPKFLSGDGQRGPQLDTKGRRLGIGGST